MRRLLAALAAVLLVLLTPVAAHAASTTRKDGDDATGPLDLSKVQLKVKGPRMIVTFTTYDAFTDDDLSGVSSMGADFETGKDRFRGISVRSPMAGGLIADICTYTPTGDPYGERCSSIKITRLSENSVQVVVPRAKIDKGARSYRWRAGSIVSTYGGDCSGVVPDCIDKAPNNNKFVTWKP